MLITHDHAIAESFARRIQMRDGEIVGDDRQATDRPGPDIRG